MNYRFQRAGKIGPTAKNNAAELPSSGMGYGRHLKMKPDDFINLILSFEAHSLKVGPENFINVLISVRQ